MTYDLKFMPAADKVVAKWKKSNPSLHKKLVKVLQDIALHPRTGIGHPPPLVGGNDITYSRHITANDRIIYNIYDDMVMVLVITVEGHYDDK